MGFFVATATLKSNIAFASLSMLALVKLSVRAEICTGTKSKMVSNKLQYHKWQLHGAVMIKHSINVNLVFIAANTYLLGIHFKLH